MLTHTVPLGADIYMLVQSHVFRTWYMDMDMDMDMDIELNNGNSNYGHATPRSRPPVSN